MPYVDPVAQAIRAKALNPQVDPQNQLAAALSSGVQNFAKAYQENYNKEMDRRAKAATLLQQAHEKSLDRANAMNIAQIKELSPIPPDTSGDANKIILYKEKDGSFSNEAGDLVDQTGKALGGKNPAAPKSTTQPSAQNTGPDLSNPAPYPGVDPSMTQNTSLGDILMSGLTSGSSQAPRSQPVPQTVQPQVTTQPVQRPLKTINGISYGPKAPKATEELAQRALDIANDNATPKQEQSYGKLMGLKSPGAGAQQKKAAVMESTAAREAAELFDNKDKAIPKYKEAMAQMYNDKSMLQNPEVPLTPQRWDAILVGLNNSTAPGSTGNVTRQEHERVKNIGIDWNKMKQRFGINDDLRDSPEMVNMIHDANETLSQVKNNNNQAISNKAYSIYKSNRSAYDNVPDAKKAFDDAYHTHQNYAKTLSDNPDQNEPYGGVNVDIKKTFDYANQHKIKFGDAEKILMKRGAYGK